LARLTFDFLNNSNSDSNSYNSVYGAVIIAVNCHCESSPGLFGQSSTSAMWLPTFRPSQSAWISVVWWAVFAVWCISAYLKPVVMVMSVLQG